MIEKWFKRISAVIAIIVLVFSPYLLVVNFKEYVPFVLTVWLISAAYYMFVIVRKNRQEDLMREIARQEKEEEEERKNKEKEKEKEEEEEEDKGNEKNRDVSRETSVEGNKD